MDYLLWDEREAEQKSPIEEQLRIALLEIKGLRNLTQAQSEKQISDGMIAAAQKATKVSMLISTSMEGHLEVETTLHLFKVEVSPTGPVVGFKDAKGLMSVHHYPADTTVSYEHIPLTSEFVLSFKEQVDKEIEAERADVEGR